MQKYRTSNQVPLMGLIVLLLAAVAGGLIVGAITAVVAHFIYLVVLFPMIMGLAGGAIIVIAVRSGKVRSPFVAVLFGVLIGVVIYGTYRYGDYFDAQRQFRDLVNQQYGEVSDVEAAQAMDQFLSEKTGSTGFVGYVLYDAQQGVKITRTASVSSDSGITFSGPLAWGYWAVELLVIAGIAAIMGRGQAIHPFCESCGTWYGKERTIGFADNKAAKVLKEALKADDFGSVAGRLAPQMPAVPRLTLTFQRCESCATSNPILYLKQTTASGRNRTATKELIRGEITPDQFMQITGQPLTE